jgi:hypothetical protein
MEARNVSPIPGAEGWGYGPFRHEFEGDAITIPLLHGDEEVAEFSVPQFVQDPEDIRGVALLVIGAYQKWQSVKGLGA